MYLWSDLIFYSLLHAMMIHWVHGAIIMFYSLLQVIMFTGYIVFIFTIYSYLIGYSVLDR